MVNGSDFLSMDKSDVRVIACFYKDVVQEIIIYGSETWVLTNPMIDRLNTFHHIISRRLTGET